MSYTSKQLNIATALMSGISEYLEQTRSYQANNFPTGLALSQNPQALDKLLNTYRVNDACFVFLIDPTQGPALMPHLEDLSSSEIDSFLASHDPIDCVDFFSKTNVLNDYVKGQEYGIPRTFLNDPDFDPAYKSFLAQGSIISNPRKP